MSYKYINRCVAWTLFLLVIIVPLLGWLQLYQWQPIFTARSIFSLLGIWAWSIMWTHYILGALRIRYPQVLKKDKIYGQVSAWLVLSLLLLHPGLLGYTQYQALGLTGTEGFNAYVGASSEIFITYGAIALLLFLSYEIFMRIHHYEKIKKYWAFVSASQMVAMLLIFIHGLGVGQSLQVSWMQSYWILLGLLLIPSFYIVGKDDWVKTKNAKNTDASSE